MKGYFLKLIGGNRLFILLVVAIAVLASMFSPRWWIVDAGSDDLLYARQALSLLNGDWLGTFQEGAALKLPGFQLFLAISAALHVPYFVLLILLQSFFAFKFSLLLLRFGYSSKTANLIFAFLVFNPALYGFSNARLLRDGFFSVLSLGIVAQGGEIYCLLKELVLNKRKLFREIIIFILISLWLVFTREEGPLAAIIIFLIFFLLFLGNRGKSKRVQQKILITFFLLTVIAISGANYTIRDLNKNFYGISSPALLQSGPLVNLVQQWSRVNPVHENSRISVSYEQRRRIYDAIPEIGSFGSKIESGAKFYQDVSCSVAQVCDQVGSGWISWAIYYTVQSESPIDTNGAVTMQRLNRWTSLIQSYCLEADLNCSRDFRLPGVGTLQNFPKVVQEIPKQMTYFVQMKSTFTPVGISYGNQSNADVFRSVISFFGPPKVWPNKKMGFFFLPHLMFLISIILLLLIVASVYNDKIQVKFDSLVNFYIMVILLSVMLRAFTTSILQVTGGDTISTQYLMPGVMLTWDLILLLLIRATAWFRSHFIKK